MTTENKAIIQQMRTLMRRMHYAYKTENTYCDWALRFIKFSHMQSRDELFDNAEAKIERFLTDLAINQQVVASTQNQALSVVIYIQT